MKLTLSSGRSRIVASLAVGAALAIAGVSTWVLSTHATDPPGQPIPPPIVDQARRPLMFDDQGEPAAERLRRAEQTANQLRRVPAFSFDLGDALLAAGDMRRVLRQPRLAKEAYREVERLHADGDHLQSRSAALGLAAADQWDQAGDAERMLWCDATEAHRQALQLYVAGDYLPALSQAQQGVALRRRLLPAEQAPGDVQPSNQRSAALLDLADSLHLAGRLCLEHSDHYAKAEPLLNEARALYSQAVGTKHPAYANALRSLAQVADERGDFDPADALYEQALAIHRQARDGDELSVDYARTLERQGRLRLAWSKDYAPGKMYRTLMIREQLLGENHPECAGSLEVLAMGALELLQFDKAEEWLRRAIEIRRRSQGADHPALAEAHSSLAACSAVQGDIALANKYHRQALVMTEQTRGATHPLLARYLTRFAELSQLDLDFHRGVRQCRQALEIYERLGISRHPDVLDAKSTLADLLTSEFGIFGEKPGLPTPRIVDAALEAVAAFEAVSGRDRLPNYSFALLQLSTGCYFDGYQRVDRALVRQILRKALTNIRANGGTKNPNYPDYLTNLSQWFMYDGNYDEAVKLNNRSHELIEKQFGGSHLYYRRLNNLMAQAGCRLHQGTRPEEVARLTRKMLDLYDEVFLRSAPGQCDVDRLCLANARFNVLGVHLTASLQIGPATDAYRDLLRTRGATAHCQTADRLAHDHQEHRKLLERVQEARHRVADLALHPPAAAAARAVWRDEFARAADNKEDLERDLALATRPLLTREVPLEVAQLQAALPPDTALIDFLQFEHIEPPLNDSGPNRHIMHLLAFVVRHDGSPQYVPLGPSAPIDEAIQAWRAALMVEDADPHPASVAARAVAADLVSRLVWKPLEDLIGDASTILIAPDGPVCYLSFAALPGKHPSTFLLEDYAIGYIPSGRQLIELAGQPAPMNTGLLVVGDIRYRERESGLQTVADRGPGLLPADAEWDNLPASRPEIDDVTDQFREGNPSGADAPIRELTGRVATLPQFLAALRQKWRYIHFGGHGFFAEPGEHRELGGTEDSSAAGLGPEELFLFNRMPFLHSGLVLAPERYPAAPGDAVLTAEHLAGLKQSGVEMLVTSSCMTGLGQTAGGEGVLGLQRAFLTAGVRTTVTSLWMVDDGGGTGVLMKQFYRNLWVEKLPKLEALRQAQLYVLNHPQKVSDRRQFLVSKGLRLPGSKPMVADVDPTREPTAGLETPPHSSLSERTPPASWAAFVLYGDGR